jgi:site-specific DNA-methyltransferase (adenine-specific)
MGGKCSISELNAGRWPANVLHDGSDEVVERFPMSTSGARAAGVYGIAAGGDQYGRFGCGPMPAIEGSEGSAARFFYTAKADAEDRNDGLPPKLRNGHPTVKPVDLMRWLVRLITPPGGVVLDPFMGSGSTGKACALENRDFVGVELDADHVRVAEARIAHAGGLFGSVVVR